MFSCVLFPKKCILFRENGFQNVFGTASTSQLLFKFQSLSSLEPDGQVDHAVRCAEGGAEAPAAHRRHDEWHGQDEQGAEEVHKAQVADQDEVDRAEL